MTKSSLNHSWFSSVISCYYEDFSAPKGTVCSPATLLILDLWILASRLPTPQASTREWPSSTFSPQALCPGSLHTCKSSPMRIVAQMYFDWMNASQWDPSPQPVWSSSISFLIASHATMQVHWLATLATVCSTLSLTTLQKTDCTLHIHISKDLYKVPSSESTYFPSISFSPAFQTETP